MIVKIGIMKPQFSGWQKSNGIFELLPPGRFSNEINNAPIPWWFQAQPSPPKDGHQKAPWGGLIRFVGRGKAMRTPSWVIPGSRNPARKPPGIVLKPVVNNGRNYLLINWWSQDFCKINSIYMVTWHIKKLPVYIQVDWVKTWDMIWSIGGTCWSSSEHQRI